MGEYMGEFFAGGKKMSGDHIDQGFSSGDLSPVSLFPPGQPFHEWQRPRARMASGKARKNLRNALRRADSPNFACLIMLLVSSIEVTFGHVECAKVTFELIGEFGLQVESLNGTYSQAVKHLVEAIIRDFAARIEARDMPYWVFSHFIKAPFSFQRVMERFEIDGSGSCDDDDMRAVVEFSAKNTF